MSRKPFFPSQPLPRRPVAAVAAAVIVLAATACEPVQPPKVTNYSAAEAADAEITAPPADQAPETEAPTPETPAPASKDLPELAMSPDVRGRDIVPGPGRVPAPRTLLGLEHHQVMALLGEPSFKRRDDPAQIWQYRDPTCILDVFLYRPKGGGAYRVTHVEVRGHGVTKVSQEDCFLRLLKPGDGAG